MTRRQRPLRIFASRGLFTALSAIAVAMLLAASAVPAAREYRVLVIISGDLPQYTAPAEAFIAAHQGEARVVDVGDSKENGRRRIEQAVAKAPVDAVFAVGAKAVWMAKEALPDLPRTFAMVIDREQYGLGAKESGVSLEMPVDALLTRFKLLLPGLERLGLIASDQASQTAVERAREAARELGIELVVERVRFSDGVPGAYRRIRSEISALWMMPDPVVVTHDNFRYLADRTKHDRVAFLAFSENFVRAGALLSVSPDYATMGSQAAALLHRHLDSPGVEPVVQPPIGSSLVVNAETARELGISVDATLLGFADEVIDDGH